ncbi:MAG: nucleoside recognition domain-containing protein [Oscillospiraceae bacterium]
MNKTLKTLILICTIYVATCMIISPTTCILAAQNAVNICLDIVIPSLFPFFVCSGVCIAMGLAQQAGRFLSPLMRPVFGVSGGGAVAFVLGIVSGYPVGANCIADLYKRGEVNKIEAERLLAFCNNSGPLFILGAVGVGMFANPQIGVWLYVSHILSALIVGMIFKHYKNDKEIEKICLPPIKKTSPIKSVGGVIGKSIESSIENIFKVCGFVIIFSVCASTLPHYAGVPYVHSILEITGGIKSLASMNISGNFKLSAVSFFIAFSGISVMLQVASIITPCGLSLKPYVLGKFLQGVISCAITYLIFTFVPLNQNAFNPDFIWFCPTAWQLLKTALFMCGWCMLAIIIMIVVAWIYDRYLK